MLSKRKAKQEAWITSGERNSIFGVLLSSPFSPFPKNIGIKGTDWRQKILHLGAREQHREILGNPSQAQKGEHWQEHLLWRPLMTECLVTAVKPDLSWLVHHHTRPWRLRRWHMESLGLDLAYSSTRTMSTPLFWDTSISRLTANYALTSIYHDWLVGKHMHVCIHAHTDKHNEIFNSC